jgi:hypothetical protein
MHPFLLKLIPIQIAEIRATKSPLNPSIKALDDFGTVMREARALLNRSGSDKKTFIVNRTDRTAVAQGKASRGRRKNLEVVSLEPRDLAPVALLLQESGIPPEKSASFLNSLVAAGPEAGFSLKDLAGRVRAMIASENGGDGRLLLEPASLLRIESSLTGLGLSPKAADRVIVSLSSTKDGEIDVEKFIRLTMRQAISAAENMAEKGRGKSESGNAGQSDESRRHAVLPPKSPALEIPTGERAVRGEPRNGIQAGLPGTARNESSLIFKAVDRTVSLPGDAGRSKEAPLFQAAEKAGAKPGLEATGTFQGETTPKSNPLSPGRNSRHQGHSEGQADRGKVWNGPETSHRSVKEVSADEGDTSTYPRTPEADPIPRQNWVKPAGRTPQPMPQSENPLPSHVAAQVSRQISRALLSGDQTVRLHLNPPQLGTLEVQLQWSGESLKIEMMTERSQVKELLLASAQELKEALVEQGYRVDRVEVHVNDLFDQSLSQPGREHRDATGKGFAQQEENAVFPDKDKGEGEAAIAFTGREDHLIDLVA